MKKINIVLIIATIILVGCTPLKRLKTVTQGNVESENYYEEIPFEYYNGEIIIEVEISAKKYYFVFDTGADLTQIDDDLLHQIAYKSNKVTNTITDANNTKKKSEYITVENIQIGTINFAQTGAFVADLSHFSEMFGCLEFDGIIGSNLMRKSNWQIDYDQKVIRFTDEISKLSSNQVAFAFKTHSGKYGPIQINLEINGQKEKFTFDTGYTGSFTSNLSFLKLLNSDRKMATTAYTFSNLSAYGKTIVKASSAYIPKLQMEDLKLYNKLINFKENGSNLIGNAFFQNYLVTLDWKNERVYLVPKHEIEDDALKSFEVLFSPDYTDNSIRINSTWDDHQLKEKIEIGSKIITINTVTVSNFNKQELCDYWNTTKKTIFNNDTIEIEVFQNGMAQKIVLTKKQLLPK